jgi:di- and tripeptidase
LSAPELLQIDTEGVVTYAHFGYIYTLALAIRDGQHILISGSGDSTIKLWRIDPESLRLHYLHTLQGEEDAAVFSVVYENNTVLAALQGGKIKVFDFDTLQCIRRLDAHSVRHFELCTIG